MAIQVINDPGFGSRIGEAIGTGLGSGITKLAEYKLAQLTKKHEQEYERSNFAKTWEPYLGKQTANFLSNLGPEERKNALGNLEQLTGAFQQPRQEQNGLAALRQNQQPTQQFDQQAQQPDQQQQITQALQQYFNNPTLGNQKQQLPQFGQQAPQQQVLGQQREEQQGQQLTPERAKLIQDIFTSPHEKREREKLDLQKQKVASAEKLGAFKETKTERAAILSEAKNAKDALARLDRMAELSKKGKLDSPLYLDFLKKTGFDIPALMTPDSQEFRKLEVDFLRDAKSIFGARVTSYEVAQFLKSIPSLSQSKEGREKVIRNLKLMNEAKLVRADALKEVLKENKGTPPLDLSEQIEERISPKIDKIHEQFVRGAEGRSEQSFNDLPPAAQFKGRSIRDKETGKTLKSNGQEWLPTE